MQYINLGFEFLPLTFIALNVRVVKANHTQRPQYYYQFAIIYLLFIYSFAIYFGYFLRGFPH